MMSVTVLMTAVRGATDGSGGERVARAGARVGLEAVARGARAVCRAAHTGLAAGLAAHSRLAARTPQ